MADRKTVPPSLDPRVVEGVTSDEFAGSDDVAKMARATLSRAHDAWEGVQKGRALVDEDPTLPDPARNVAHAEFADKHFSPVFERMDATRSAIEAGIEAEREAITKSSRPPLGSGDLQVEVRTRLSNMPAEERRKLVESAIREGDTLVAGSVLHAPGWLAGVSDNGMESYRAMWAQLHAAERLERIENLTKLRDRLDEAGTVIGQEYAKVASKARKAREASKRRQEAMEA